MNTDDITNLKNHFYRIKNMGWICSNRIDSGAIGVTFENLIGLESNELEIPDFGQIEIKTKTKYSKSYTTLFNCTPTGPHYHEVERLKNKYGYPDSTLKKFKILNTSIYCTHKIKVGLNNYFKLKIDRKSKRLFLIIYDKNQNLIEENVFWDFDILEEKLYRKLKFLVLIKAEKKYILNKKYFKYCNMYFYKLKDFNTFIDLIEKGVIRISIKIGIYKDKKKLGKIHDHGTSFSIQEENLEKLYNLINKY